MSNPERHWRRGVDIGDADGSGDDARQHERLAFSVDEAAAQLGISRDLAYDLVNRGEMPFVRLGRRIVVPRKALAELLGG